MAIEDYENATIQELQAEIVESYRQEKIKEQIDTKVNTFISYRDLAKKKFLEERDAELQAKLQEWQTYEDNDYTIPQAELDELDAYAATQ